jgi:hypothetical protein
MTTGFGSSPTRPFAAAQGFGTRPFGSPALRDHLEGDSSGSAHTRITAQTQTLRCRSGFRHEAPATLTPRKRLKLEVLADDYEF